MYCAKGGIVLCQYAGPNTAMSLIRPRRTSYQLSALSIGPRLLESRLMCFGQRKEEPRTSKRFFRGAPPFQV